MKITYRGIEVILNGRNVDGDFGDKPACEFLNYVVTMIFSQADTAEEKGRTVVAKMYRREASNLFDQIALTGFYGEDKRKEAVEAMMKKR